MAFTTSDLAQLPRTTATLERDGEQIAYEGVLLYDLILKTYGLPAGKPLPVNSKASYVRGTCRDGYTVVISLGEIAPNFSGNRVVVADKRVDGPLLGYQQPAQLIVPQDKVHGRSAFSLIKLEVVELQP